MPLTATDNVTELDISELVDLEKQPACEHQAHESGLYGHSGPAWAVIHRWYKCGCHPSDTILICKSAYDRSKDRYLFCGSCGHSEPRDEGWQLLSVL